MLFREVTSCVAMLVPPWEKMCRSIPLSVVVDLGLGLAGSGSVSMAILRISRCAGRNFRRRDLSLRVR